ncbi:hypothetical protein [Lysinibacillus xylanilyticus]|uniref:hypothetical protein n=1 Tax=Lysinibacillus xylanilyticus TaxID=582475 RepID=UPI0036DBBDC3
MSYYLIYNEKTKLVYKITDTEPVLSEVPEGHAVATSANYPPGIELEYAIVINTVNEKGEAISSYSSVQPQPAQQLLKKVDELEKENKELKLALAESAEVQQQDKIENQLAIAELAELIATKEVI